jgi:hypothetical protein
MGRKAIGLLQGPCGIVLDALIKAEQEGKAKFIGNRTWEYYEQLNVTDPTFGKVIHAPMGGE